LLKEGPPENKQPVWAAFAAFDPYRDQSVQPAYPASAMRSEAAVRLPWLPHTG